jgi:Cu(I)/Ag(I) efflux system protein CusF
VKAFRTTLAVSSLALLALPFAVSAQMAHSHGHGQSQSMDAAKEGQADMTDGEVRKIDPANKKITLQHGSSQGMPAMAMVYAVADPALLGNVKVGDKVRFRAADAGGGKMTVTEILPIR